MDLKEIQDKLNQMFAGSGRRIVFWYDDEASYEENIHDFELAEGAKLWIVKENNWFETKLQIEEKDPESNYLLYAPFPRPDDRENFLADIFYYSQHFYSDKLVQIMGDLGIDMSCQDEVKRFRKFWTAGNTDKFRKLAIEDITKEKLHLGMLCVLAGVKTLNFDELLKKVVLAGTEENSILKKMEALQIAPVFWSMCEKNLGYKDPTPTIPELLCTMIVTYMDTVTGGDIQNPWKTFLSARQNDAVVFVKNLMNNDESKGFYDAFAERMSAELNAGTMIRQIDLRNVLECDALPDFDENLLGWMIAKIDDGMLDEKVAGLAIPQICEERIKPCYHFNERFGKRYRMIFHAWQVLKGVTLHTFKPTLSEVVQDYTENAWQIDRHYRKFYFYLDAVGLTPETEKLRDLVENYYTNKYLTDFSYKWNQILTDEAYRDYAGSRQEQFYQDFVRPFMREDGREGRVIVIISDGMRYECGRQLFENLELDEKCKVWMNHMLSVLPSETTLGMASLLPNKDILVDTELNISVDGMKCGNSTVDRQKILQTRIPRSICVDFDRLMTAKQSELSHLERIQVAFSNENRRALRYNYGKDLGKFDQKRWIPEQKVQENLELAYAISVHKSQGSEFDYVYIVIPKRDSHLLSMELLYTALTRAQKKVTVFLQDDIGTLSTLGHLEKSAVRRINSSIFEFKPLPEELLYATNWYASERKLATLSEYFVRSKSEVIIANMLVDRDIPFKYEEPLYAADGTMYLPDFTVTFRGETYYWEHVGMLDRDNYRKHWEKKQKWYEKNFPGQLLVTYEGQNLTQDALDIIKAHA